MFADFVKLAERAKAYAALAGSALTALMGSTGFALVPEEYRPWFAVALAVMTGIATFQIPNAEPTSNLD